MSRGIYKKMAEDGRDNLMSRMAEDGRKGQIVG